MDRGRRDQTTNVARRRLAFAKVGDEWEEKKVSGLALLRQVEKKGQQGKCTANTEAPRGWVDSKKRKLER